MSWTIARPRPEDLEELARVHVEVWREAYAGLMPPEHLASLDPVANAERWRERFAHPMAGLSWWVARDGAGLVGMTTSGPARDEDPPVALELYAINVLRRAHGTGLADDLLAHALGDRAAYLWVLEGNDRAMAFYRRHGFTDEGGRKPEPGTGLMEIRMARGHRPAHVAG